MLGVCGSRDQAQDFVHAESGLYQLIYTLAQCVDLHRKVSGQAPERSEEGGHK